MTQRQANPVPIQTSEGRRGAARLPQSMLPRTDLPLDWLRAVAESRGERDRIRVSHAGLATDYRLFFLTGHPRSGTHWLGALLNLHPLVHTDGEFFFEALREGYQRLSGWKWLAVAGDPGHRTLAQSCFEDSVRRLLVAIAARKPGATHIGDRTPGKLAPFLPGASHVVAVRDGRDVLVSWTFHQLRVGGRQLIDFCRARGGGRGAAASSPGEPGGMEPVRRAFAADPHVFDKQPGLLLSDERWVRAMASQWAEHVRHDTAVLHDLESGRLDGRALIVRYEALHADPQLQIARVFEFLGLDPALAEPVSDRTGTAPGHGSEDPGSFFRAGRIGDWKRFFSPDASRWFESEAGEALSALGYATEGAP